MRKTPPAHLHSLTSRPYAGKHDLLQMQDFLMEARSRTDDWHYCHIGEMLFSYFMVSCHLNPEEHILLWHDQEQKLAAYAILGEDPAIDFQVLPEYEGSGIEHQVMDWAETRLRHLRACDPQQWGGNLVSGAREDNPGRISFLKQYGFRYCGGFAEVNMIRSLDEPIPGAVVPKGYHIRAVAATGETSRRAAAQREVWMPWTVGNVTDDDYAEFMLLPGYHRDLDVVAVTQEGEIVSYVNGWIDPVNRIGDFGPVGAVPAYRQLGLTRAVLLEGLRRMCARGMNRVCVSTGISNIPALRLYESIGFRKVNRYLDFVQAKSE